MSLFTIVTYVIKYFTHNDVMLAASLDILCSILYSKFLDGFYHFMLL